MWILWLSFAAKGMGRISSELQCPFALLLQASPEDHCLWLGTDLASPPLLSLIWAGIGRASAVPSSVKKHLICPECHKPGTSGQLEVLTLFSKDVLSCGGCLTIEARSSLRFSDAVWCAF